MICGRMQNIGQRVCFFKWCVLTLKNWRKRSLDYSGRSSRGPAKLCVKVLLNFIASRMATQDMVNLHRCFELAKKIDEETPEAASSAAASASG